MSFMGCNKTYNGCEEWEKQNSDNNRRITV